MARLEPSDGCCRFYALRELDYHVKKSPSTDAVMQYLRQTLWYLIEFTKMKIERHGQAKILTQQEIELLFNIVKDIYTNSGTVRSTINFCKANTKGKLQTRTRGHRGE